MDIPKKNKNCGNCINCDKVSDTNWCCETYGFYYCGAPVHVEPPYDEACKMWTDDPKQKNSWLRWM